MYTKIISDLKDLTENSKIDDEEKAQRFSDIIFSALPHLPTSKEQLRSSPKPIQIQFRDGNIAFPKLTPDDEILIFIKTPTTMVSLGYFTAITEDHTTHTFLYSPSPDTPEADMEEFTIHDTPDFKETYFRTSMAIRLIAFFMVLNGINKHFANPN